jgi:hypothetical protein
MGLAGMFSKSEISVIAFAFILGLVIPFLLSAFSMMVSFRVGVAATRALVPLSSVRDVPDAVITGGNGAIYAGVGLLVVLLRRLAD